jgi:hypothetical protein
LNKYVSLKKMHFLRSNNKNCEEQQRKKKKKKKKKFKLKNKQETKKRMSETESNTSTSTNTNENVERPHMPFADVPELRGPVANEKGIASLFVRPARGMTNMFYTYMETDAQWYWTPDQAQEFWMPCSTLLVSQGKWAGKKPAYFNVEIIQWLNDARPAPPANGVAPADLATLVEDFFDRPLPQKAGDAAKLNAALGTSNIQSTAVVRGESGTQLTLDNSRVKPKDTLVFKDCHNAQFTIDAYCTKVHIDDCSDCSFVFAAKVVSAVAEIYKCNRLTLDIRTPVKTLQVEGCDTVAVTFSDPENFHSVVWAGTKALGLTVAGLENAAASRADTGVDVLRARHPDMTIRDDIDQFITRLVDGALLSERIIRLPNGFPTTEREKADFEDRQEKNMQAFVKNAGLKVYRTEHKEPKAPGRNDQCSCSSGKKYKVCCGAPKKLEKL